MVISIGLRDTGNKEFFRTGNTKGYKCKNTFNKLFMRGLAQLMKDKNALKTDAYKYQYKEPEKKKKATTK